MIYHIKQYISLVGFIFIFNMLSAFPAHSSIILEDNFDDNVLDAVKWQEFDHPENFIREANRKLYFLGGSSALISKDKLVPVDNLTLVATIEPRQSGIAIGFKDAGDEYNLKNMVCGFYLTETGKNDTAVNNIQIYENGQVKENPEWGWLADYPFKIKIVLNLGQGASYYIQGVGYAEFGGSEWTLLYRSAQPLPKELKAGVINSIKKEGTAALSDWVLRLDDLYLSTSAFEAPLTIKNLMLAQPAAHSMTLLVKTNILSDVNVAYGTDQKYGQSALAEKALIHEITIPNLKPATAYHYQLKVQESGKAENSQVIADQTFKTAPEAGNFSFAVIGDMQRCEIGETIAALSANIPDFIITAGDNIGGERAYFTADFAYRWQVDVFDYLQGLTNHLPLFVTPGNHDYLKRRGQALTAYRQELSLPNSAGREERYYSFDYADAHFVVLDSTTNSGAGSVDVEQIDWLDGDLAKTAKRWKFVFAHHMIYGADETKYIDLWRLPEYEILHKLFVKYKVNAYFGGHRHVYNRYIKDGVVYLCNPSAGVGRCLESKSGEDNYPNDNHGESGTLPKAVGNQAGFTKVDVKTNEVEFSVVKNDGSLVDKYQVK
ncbi:MAG: metallophosphoesterase [Candidatus Schekmanbacteria bacterium]|nr:metallophosphoesterase [Candidatus Schekmanbacteria bacterium]